MNKTLVIGGTGFIGSNLSNYLINEGIEVTIIRKSKSFKSNYEISNSCKIFCANIANYKELLDLNIEWDFNFVINASGYGDHSKFSNTDNDIINSHFLGVINIVRILKKEYLKRYIHIGSGEEYGKRKHPSTEILREESYTPYAFSKTAATHFLQMLYRSENFPSVILRPFLVYGNNQAKKKLIPYIIDKCLKNENILLTGGNQVRDFIHINDLISAIKLICNSKENYINGEIYDVSAGDIMTVKEITKKIQNITEGGNPIYGSKIIRDTEGQSLYSNSKKLRDHLNWQPQVKLDSGLKEMISYRKKFSI
tara:strand:- start:371 stop:1300 length:930 start_codon:yes stop_codon:yes gene_type:complete